MTSLAWNKRSSKTNRVSYTQFLSDLQSGRQSQSVERTSRIPLRASSQSGRNKGLQNQNKPKSKSQVPSTSTETPLSHGKYTPQFFFGSRITSGASSNVSNKRASHYKDPRNLQDKEFLKEASHLVQSYFQEKCPEILINNSEIKPMTIKMFIAMVNHLFEVLGIVDKGIEPLRFAASTFEKELPYWMKKLEYPGLITKAWLQTVNVPQYWPHVVGLLSWLVKLCSVNSLFDIEEQLTWPIESFHEWWGTYFFKKSMEAFLYYNEGKEDELKELCTEMISKFRALNGLSENTVKEIQNEIDELSGKIEDPTLLADKDAYDQMEQQLKNLELNHQKLLDDIEKKNIYIEELKMKIFRSQKNCTLIRSNSEETKTEIENLQKAISAQSVSVEDIADIEKKTGYLDKEIKCLEKECEDYYQFLSKYDVDAVAVQDKILQSSHAFNRNIIQLEQIIPELNKFHIYINLENDNTQQEMENMVKSLNELKRNLIQKHQNLEQELVASQKNINDKKQRLKELQNAMRSKEKKIEAKENENLKLLKHYEDKEKVLKEEYKNWNTKINAFNGKIKELSKLKERRKVVETRHKSVLCKMAKKEEFWDEFWKKVEEKWGGIPIHLELLLDMISGQNLEWETVVSKNHKA